MAEQNEQTQQQAQPQPEAKPTEAKAENEAFDTFGPEDVGFITDDAQGNGDDYGASGFYGAFPTDEEVFGTMPPAPQMRTVGFAEENDTNNFTLKGKIVEAKPIKANRSGTEYIVEWGGESFSNFPIPPALFAFSSFSDSIQKALAKYVGKDYEIVFSGRLTSREVQRKDGTGSFFTIGARINFVRIPELRAEDVLAATAAINEAVKAETAKTETTKAEAKPATAEEIAKLPWNAEDEKENKANSIDQFIRELDEMDDEPSPEKGKDAMSEIIEDSFDLKPPKPEPKAEAPKAKPEGAEGSFKADTFDDAMRLFAEYDKKFGEKPDAAKTGEVRLWLKQHGIGKKSEYFALFAQATKPYQNPDMPKIGPIAEEHANFMGTMRRIADDHQSRLYNNDTANDVRAFLAVRNKITDFGNFTAEDREFLLNKAKLPIKEAEAKVVAPTDKPADGKKPKP